jgi:hypothetical protein
MAAWSNLNEKTVEKVVETKPIQPVGASPQPIKKPLDTTAIEDFFNKKQEVLKEETGMDVLLFGDTNVGKTFVSMTFPEPIFVIDTEKRAEKSKKYHFPGKDIRIFDPVTIKKNYSSVDDAIDYEATIDNISNFIVALNRRIESGEIKQGTLVFDSLTDLWKWCEDWAKERLARKGKVDKDILKLNNQFDWGLATDRHRRLLTIFREVISSGMNFVATAREANVPSYVVESEKNNSSLVALPTKKIRTQKDAAFAFSTVLNLRLRRLKIENGFQNKYLTDVLKLDTLDCKKDSIENISYDKLKVLILELSKNQNGGN